MLWGAFNNSSSAMMAMSWDMGSISQNIANVNTNGYKRKETLFKTVMSESHASPSAFSGKLNIFGVQTADRTHISAQGVITPSAMGTDMAINGEGFFLVAPGMPTDGGGEIAPLTASVDNPEQVMYTRDGAFRFKTGPNDERFFTTGSGHYVLGYMADEDGVITAGTLEPVYSMPQTTMEGKATTTATILANLPSEADQTANSVTTTSTITDPLGNEQTLSVNWERFDGVTWTVTASVDAAVGTASLGPITVTMDGWGNISVPTTLTQSVSINWDDGVYGAATADSTETVNLSDSKPAISLEKISVEVFDADGNSQVAILGFEKATFFTGQAGTASSKWYIHPSAGQYATTGTTPVAGVITFDSFGNVVDGGEQTADFSWTRNGTTTTASITGDLSNMTQLNGGLTIGHISQDGYADGDMLRSYFTEKGEFMGYFTNGETRSLFKIPIAQFISENSLEAISGTLFKRTPEAGEIAVSFIEDATGEPRFITSAIENSTVDIEDEFTKMIMTQKAYTTNATVFKTADEMTTVARDLKA